MIVEAVMLEILVKNMPIPISPCRKNPTENPGKW